jgi:predicted NAD/FAD-dependent oxidoreductase
MKRTLIAAGAALILSFPMTVHAQPGAEGLPAAGVQDHGDYTLKQREDWLDNRIDKAHDDGSLDGHEADRVHRKLDRIKHDEDKYRDHHGGGQLTDNETAELEARLNQLADRIHWLHENNFQRPW